MKYDSYEQYYNSAVEFYKDKNEIKIPLEYMILTKELFDAFNGYIDFGPGSVEKKCKCTNCDCQQ